MVRQVIAVAVATCAMVGLAQDVRAQSERAWVDVNVGVASAAEKDYGVVVNQTVFQEQARFAADYKFPTGANVDFGGGFLFTKAFGAGVSVSGTAHKGPATVSATIPHPRFFNAAATGTAETDDLEKTEGAIHLQAVFAVPTSDRVRLRLFGGPSYFQVKQDTIDDVRYLQNAQLLSSGNVVTVIDAPFSKAEASAWGFHVGADVSVFFTRVVGIGAFGRFSRATVDLSDLGGQDVSVKAGGVQAGVGLRLKF